MDRFLADGKCVKRNTCCKSVELLTYSHFLLFFLLLNEEQSVQ